MYGIFKSLREAWTFALGCATYSAVDMLWSMSDQMARGEVSDAFGFSMIFVCGGLLAAVAWFWRRAE